MLSKTASVALGRVHHTITRTFVLSSVKQSSHGGIEDKSLVKSTQKALDLAKSDDPRIQKIAPLDCPLEPLVTELPQETKERLYPQIGNRDIVGPTPGMIIYSEEIDQPLPAVRWGANTPEIMALREKEKGSWHDLSIVEKKQLYRHSFRQTIVEMEAPDGEYKKQMILLLYGMALTAFLCIWTRLNAFIDDEPTFGSENTQEMIKRMVREYRNPITGVAAKYDYENGCWKK